jgi:carbon storage regulator CsrA
MLVLSRRLNEQIVLPGLGITVQLVAIEHGRVRLGIEAPPEVRILREELIGQALARRPAHRASFARE